MREKKNRGRALGFIFGTGAMLMALFMVVRLLPKVIGLAVWLVASGITASSAALLLYLVTKGNP